TSAVHRPYRRSSPTRRSSDLHTGEERRGAKDSEVQERLLQRALTLRETKAKDQRDRNSDSDNHPVDGPVRELLDEEHKGNQQDRSEEHTSELQSRFDLVCRLL